MILGNHESTAGGCHLAFERARARGADAIQLFLKSARTWKAKELSRDDVALFAQAASASPIRHAMAHASYLVNPAAEPGPIREKSLAGLVDELRRAEAFGLPGLVLHPGSHPDRKRGLVLAAKLVDEALALVPGKVEIWLENTAGQGHCLGAAFDDLGALLELSRHAGRLGICFDTCHAFAAGHDLGDERSYRRAMRSFGLSVGGLSAVRAFHLNDSKKPLGCRVDRHAEIGRGEMGLAPFRHLVNDGRFARVPGVLETPNPDGWKAELARLRRLVRRRPGRARASESTRRSARLRTSAPGAL